MKLNCDLGESFGSWQMGLDEQVMPLIDMANIACGFHAGDPQIMRKTVQLAKAQQVTIGAHPSYQDLQGFGRRSIKYSKAELISLLQYQIGALQAICQAEQTTLSYVKPHGALYNDMMANIDIFSHICQAISELNQTNQQSLTLVIQAIPNLDDYQTIANTFNIKLMFEAFADRNYQANGLLLPRSIKNAVIKDVNEISTRIKHLINTGELLAADGTPLTIKVDTLCVHGDNQAALEITQAMRALLTKER